MKTVVIFFIALIYCWQSNAHDIFDGFARQFLPCFKLVHQEGCDTSIPNVYESPFLGDEMNSPDTSFFLFTSKNPEKAEPLHRCGGRLPVESDFDPEAKTIFFIHGWIDGVCRSAIWRELKLLLLKRGGYNVILVDWTWGNTIDHQRPAFNAITVGDQLGFVIKNIMERMNITGDNFHIVGHSLGNISSGLAAKFILDWNPNNKLGRITALEPTLELNDMPPERKLSHKDAKFVDVIHTNGGICFPFDHDTTLGHVDFYPNGGKYQTACFTYIVESLLKGDFFYAFGSFYPPLCSHLQSLQFFKATIPRGNYYVGIECKNYNDFKSGACKRCCKKESKNCAVAGLDADLYFPFKDEERRERRYFFQTASTCPFAEDYEKNLFRDC